MHAYVVMFVFNIMQLVSIRWTSGDVHLFLETCVDQLYLEADPSYIMLNCRWVC